MAKSPAKWSFDEIYWTKAVRRPDWYLEFVAWSQKIQDSIGKDTEEANQFRKTIRHFFEQQLEVANIALASEGPDWDAERRSIDTVVIHHTSAKPGYRLHYMNATQLLNVYAHYFANPTNSRDRSVRGQPIWSGHFKQGKQIFWLYHWLMRMDGTFERLLDDDQIGWHAGNWDINKRSVGICLDNDYERQDPTDEILQKLAAHIKKYYPRVKTDKIIGHCEARQGTICPGTNFIDGWKNNLLSYAHDS